MGTLMVQSCIRGHHVYKSIWTPEHGELVVCKQEFGNIMDPYAVAVVRQGSIVGHIPRKISAICHLFLRHGGQMVVQVVGPRRHSVDLPQGGLEVPCTITFYGSEKEVAKVKMMLDIAAATTDHVAKVIGDSKSASSAQPPSKKLKTDDKVHSVPTIDTTDKETGCTFEDDWIKFGGLLVTKSDELALVNNKKLNDRHINLAQKILMKQFPGTEGLGYTIMQHKPPLIKISQGLQIIFIKGNHWIVASSLLCSSSVVQVYDSIYTTVDEDTKEVIFNLFESSRKEIVLVSTPKQNGGQDCGVFAIAIATALLFKVDVSTTHFHQSEMRKHLHLCFLFKQMSLFPTYIIN